ncbi:MAG: GntR family transcriptional regulator [Rhodobacterales bacterium]|nr:GntR family transcriptional regulator [Rhodobacterales bacterium]
MARLPKYIQIADTLRAEIGSARYPLGAKLPPETRLCERFSASRFTVREAIKKLASEKLVKTEQGAGTIVVSLLSEGGYAHTYTSLEDLTNYAQRTWLEIQSVDEGFDTYNTYPKLAFMSDVSLTKISSLRKTVDHKIIALVESYIESSKTDYALETIKNGGPIYAGIEKKFGVAINSVQQETFALGASVSAAEMLKVNVGEPVLGILRSYYFGGKIGLASFNQHYGQDRYSYVTEINLNAGK